MMETDVTSFPLWPILSLIFSYLDTRKDAFFTTPLVCSRFRAAVREPSVRAAIWIKIAGRKLSLYTFLLSPDAILSVSYPEIHSNSSSSGPSEPLKVAKILIKEGTLLPRYLFQRVVRVSSKYNVTGSSNNSIDERQRRLTFPSDLYGYIIQLGLEIYGNEVDFNGDDNIYVDRLIRSGETNSVLDCLTRFKWIPTSDPASRGPDYLKETVVTTVSVSLMSA
jgi:hypothetical protein